MKIGDVVEIKSLVFPGQTIDVRFTGPGPDGSNGTIVRIDTGDRSSPVGARISFGEHRIVRIIKSGCIMEQGDYKASRNGVGSMTLSTI